MSQKPDNAKPSSERRAKDIRPATRRQYSAEKNFRCSSLRYTAHHVIRSCRPCQICWSSIWLEAVELALLPSAVSCCLAPPNRRYRELLQ